MKKILLVMMLLTVIMVVNVQAQDVQAPTINITLMNQDPDPVDPGQYVEIRFKIYNDYPGTTAEDFQVDLEPEYPFSLDSNEDPLRNIGDLPALGDGSNVIVVKYKVKVDENAVEGANPIQLRYRHGNTGWITREFDVNVQTVDANLAIVSVESDPEKVKPGEEAQLSITVKNMADSRMKDVTFKLDLTYSDLLNQATATTASDSITAFNSLPFAPLGSSTEQKIYSLMPGEEHEFVYNLIAYSDAESKVYKIPVTLTYYDELETEYTKNDIIGLVVGSKPDLSVVVDESELYVGQRSGSVFLRFINKGFSDVKFLDVTLEDTDDFDILSANEVYVGNVDSDDYETAEFQLYLKNGIINTERTVILPLNIEYRDANNNLYSEEHDLELQVIDQSKLQGSSGPSALTILLVVAVIVGLIFFFWKRRKRKRK